MDKKNTIIGVTLLVAALGLMFLGPKLFPPPAAPAQPIATAPATAPAGTATTPAAAGAPGTATPTGTTATTAAAATAAAPVANSAFASVSADAATATVTTLANDFVEVRFSNFGGAVRDIALKKYPAALHSAEPFVFNALHADPLLALVEFPGLDRHVSFQLVSKTATEVVYRAERDGLEVTRHYTLAPSTGKNTDPYQLRHETTFRNLGDKNTAPFRVAFSLGTAAPTNELDTGVQLATGHSTGSDQDFILRSALESSGGFLGMGAHDLKPLIATGGPLTWASVQNQFFASILTPDEPAAGLVTRRVKLHAELPDTDPRAYGITGAAQFDLKPLAPRAEAKLASSLYVGPKEYSRLSNSDVFKADEDKVMHFGFFKFFSQLLLKLMTWIHSLVPNWGVAIVLTTLSLKLIFLPLTMKASRSMKRMAKLAPLMQALREKFKDNPAKQQAAIMELYKEHKVNPMGGCLPMLIPFPFFLGFFSMLQSTAELRYAPFLWVPDLSATDTVGHLFGISINVLPVLFTALTFVQMKLTPTPNADPTQAKMMQFMPLIFLFIYYSMPAALSLYSAANALFTIAQQVVINRMKDDGDPTNHPAAVTAPGGKPVKNVTPKKK